MVKLLKNPPVTNLLPQKRADQAALQVWGRGRWDKRRESSPLEERKCLLGAVKPLVPCTLTAATRNWYQRLARVSGSRTRSSVVWWGKQHTYTACSDMGICHLLCNTSQPGRAHTSATACMQPPHLTPATTLHCKAFTAVNRRTESSNFTVHCRSLQEKK